MWRGVFIWALFYGICSVCAPVGSGVSKGCPRALGIPRRPRQRAREGPMVLGCAGPEWPRGTKGPEGAQGGILNLSHRPHLSPGLSKALQAFPGSSWTSHLQRAPEGRREVRVDLGPPGPPWDPLGLHLDPLSGPNLVHHMAPEPPYASGGGPVPQQWGPLGPPRAPLRPPWGSLWTHLLDLTWSITRPLRLPTPPLGPCP